jgi:hypothetical protein
MTLADWKACYEILPTHPTTERGAVSVLCRVGSHARRDLYGLDDYAVSSVSGPVVWLLPRRPET